MSMNIFFKSALSSRTELTEIARCKLTLLRKNNVIPSEIFRQSSKLAASGTTASSEPSKRKSSNDVEVSVKIGPRRTTPSTFDYDSVKTDRNFITPLRAMRNYHLEEKDIAAIPFYYRRSAATGGGDTPMKVLRASDVERRAIEVHGSKEALEKLDKRVRESESRMQYLKFLLNSPKRVRSKIRNDPFQYNRSGTSARNPEIVDALGHKSMLVVQVAVGVNLLNALGKFGAYMITGSSSMFAEAIHSCADTANQCILLFGKLTSRRTASTEHPYGFSNFQNVTALISGVGVFCLGAGMSIYHGINVLVHPVSVSHLGWSYAMLGLAFVTEGASLTLAYNQLRRSAKKEGVSFIKYLRRSNDPTVHVVFTEDAAAVVGIFIAGSCMGLTSLTGNVFWDAFGSLGVGGLLGLVSVYIINTNAKVLIGQSIPEEKLRQMQRVLERDRMVRGLHDVKATEIGVGHVRFKAETDFDGKEVTAAYLSTKVDMEVLLAEVACIKDLKGLEHFLLTHGEGVVDQLGEEVDRLEKKLRICHPDVRHVDLEVL